MSYLIAVVRTVAIYTMIHKETFHIKVWLCKNNFLVNLINFATYIFIDIIPIFTIFFLHWKNFRDEVQKENLRENYDRDKIRVIRDNPMSTRG